MLARRPIAATIIIAAYAATSFGGDETTPRRPSPAGGKCRQRKQSTNQAASKKHAPKRPVAGAPVSQSYTASGILDALDKKTSVIWDSVPLGKILDQLWDQSGVTILIDPVGVLAGDIDANARITLNLSNTTIKNILNEVFRKSLKLEWIIEDEVIKIVTTEKAKAIEACRREIILQSARSAQLASAMIDERRRFVGWAVPTDRLL